MRSYLGTEAKTHICSLYKLENMELEECAREVRWLIERDRWICYPSQQDVAGWRFTNPAIAKLVFKRWFSSERRLGCKDKEFEAQINGVTLCLVGAVLHHALQHWVTGKLKKYVEFGYHPDEGKQLKIPRNERHY